MNIENNTSIIDESSIYDYTKQYLQDNGLLNTEKKEETYRTSLILESHVTAWSKGGATDITNCQMLCIAHNRMKGNK